MNNLIITVLGGLLVIIIAGWFGLGGNTKVTIKDGGRIKKTGKWIIIISVIMILSGLAWTGSSSKTQGNKIETIYGFTLVGYGLIFLFVGKIVEWFQKL